MFPSDRVTDVSVASLSTVISIDDDAVSVWEDDLFEANQLVYVLNHPRAMSELEFDIEEIRRYEHRFYLVALGIGATIFVIVCLSIGLSRTL